MSPEELPEEWCGLSFEDTIDFVIGGEWGKSESEKPDEWLAVRVIRGTEFRDWAKHKGSTGAIRFIKPASLQKRQLREGDIVFEISGGGPDQPVGRTALIDKEALSRTQLPLICSNFCRLVRLKSFVVPAYLDYCMKWKYFLREFDEYQNQTVNIRNLEFPRFASETTIPLPPLVEQRRIVAAVERILDKVTAARDCLDRVPKTMKRFRHAVFAAACSGRLTSDWRANNPSESDASRIWIEAIHRIRQSTSEGRRLDQLGRPLLERMAGGEESGWITTRIGDISECLDHLRRPVRKDIRGAGSIPYYGANGRTGWIDTHLFDEELVLVVEDETFVGREIPFSYVIRGKSWVNNHAHILRPLGGMSAEFLNILLARYDFVPLTSGTTGRRKLVKSALISAPISVPPLAEQQEIVKRVSALFAHADAIEATVTTARKRVDLLTQAVLAKAFRGELVPTEAELARREKRTFESASEMLARMRDKTETKAKPKRTRKQKAAEGDGEPQRD